MISHNLTRTTVRIAAMCCMLVLLLLPAGTQAQFQTVTIPVANGPIALALNQTTHLLYVANQSANSVSVIDTNAGNPTFNAVVAGPIPVGTAPFAIAVNQGTNRVYVANSGSGNVSIIDGASNTVITTIAVNIAPISPQTNPPTMFPFHPSALAVNPNTNEIVVGNADCGFVVIDGASSKVEYTNYLGLCGQNAVAVDLVTNAIFVAAQNDADVQMFTRTVANGTVTYTATAGFNATQPIALGFDQSAGLVYAADLSGFVEVFNAGTKQTIENDECTTVNNTLPFNTLPLPCITTPAGGYALAVNPNTSKAYVLNQSNAGGPATLSVVSGTGITSNITVGNSALPVRLPAAYKVLVDPVANLVYVANDGSNNVTFIDGNTDSVLFTAATGIQPFALAKDATTGDVYVANFSGGTAGSVTVLEVAPSSANLFSSTSYTFGPQAVGTTSPAQLVTLVNRGASSLTVSSIVPIGDFSETDNCVSTSNPPIPIGGSCTIQVTFTPTVAGTRNGQLTVNDSDPSSPQVITLSGTGTGAGLTVTPSALVFGATIINQGSSQQGVTVTNTGAAPLVFQFTSTNTTGDFSLDNGCTPAASGSTVQIAPGGACTIEVQFFPTASGVRTGQLIITDYSSGSGVNYNVPLTGYSITAQGVQPLAPSLVFGSQLVGTTSPGLVETLTNAGFGNLSVSSVTASGDFAVVANNCAGASVAPQTSCEFVVTFTPTRSGARQGQVLIFDNDNYSPQVVTLSGVGSPYGVTLAPATLSFGMQPTNVQGLPQTVTLTNTGTSNLTISSIAPDGDENWLETDNCTSPAFGPIPVGGSCTITVTEAPLTIGRLTGLGQLIIVDSDPSSPHFVGLASASTGLQLSVSPSFLSGPGVVSVSDTLSQPLISKVQAIGGWTETDTCSPPAFTLTTCTVTVSGGSGVGQITIDDVNHTNGPMIVALAGPYSIPSLMNTPANAPAGPPVNVAPIDAGSGTAPVSLTFPSGSITTGGITSLTIQSSGPQPPSGFQLGTPPVYYYIQTTAVFTGSVTICITSPSVTGTSQLLHFGSGGTVNITSTVLGNTICGMTTSFSPFAIVQPAGKISTALGLNSSANPSVAGQAVTFTAVFGGTGFPPAGAPAPTGSVTFMDGSNPLGAPVSLPTSGQIAFTTSTLSAGPHTITAQYSGDGNYAGSSSNSVTQNVNQTATLLSLTSSANPSVVGQALTFTSALSGTSSVPPGVPAPTGTVTFTVDGAVFGSPVSLSGELAAISITSLVAGSHTVSAQYSGDSDYAASSSNVVTQTVNKNASGTSLSASATLVTLGQTFTLSALVAGAGTGSLPPGLAAPTGSVTFFDGSTPLGSPVTLPAGPAMLSVSSLTAGTHSLTAQYSGDANFAASISTPVQVTVTNSMTSTALTSSGPSVYGQPVTFSADVIAVGGGTLSGNVAFVDTVTGTPLGSSMVNSSGVATLLTSSLAAGTHSITAKYAGNGTLAASSSPALPQVVSPAPLSVTAVPAAGNNVSRPYGANNPAVSPVITGIVNGDSISATDMTSATPSSPVGVYVVTPAISDPANRLGNYAVTSVNGTLTVVPETTLLAVAVSPSSIVVGQLSTVTITLTAPDMVIPINPSVLASVSLSSAIATDVISNGGMCTPVPTAAAGTASCTLTVTSSLPNGRTLTANFAGSADLVASTGSAQLIVTEPVQGQQSCIQSDFRNVAVPGGSYIWLNSIFRVRDVNKQIVHISFANSTVQYQYTDASGNLVSVNLAVPNAQITINPSVTVASTSFDPVNNVWNTTLPWDLDDNAFLSGMSWLVPAAGLPADVEPVNWCGTFAVDVTGAHIGWRWAAAAYSSAFSANNAALGVKAMDTDGDNPGNQDLAGTPENYKQFVILGARGKGGKNYTGTYSRSAAIE
jgi:YVTN family beta-propeller protein